MIFARSKRKRREEEAVASRRRFIKKTNKAMNSIDELNKVLKNGITLKIYRAAGGRHGY